MYPSAGRADRFKRQLGSRSGALGWLISEHVHRPAQGVSPPAEVRQLGLGHSLQELGQVWVVWMAASVRRCRVPLQTLVLVPIVLAAHERVNQFERPQLTGLHIAGMGPERVFGKALSGNKISKCQGGHGAQNDQMRGVMT